MKHLAICSGILHGCTHSSNLNIISFLTFYSQPSSIPSNISLLNSRKGLTSVSTIPGNKITLTKLQALILSTLACTTLTIPTKSKSSSKIQRKSPMASTLFMVRTITSIYKPKYNKKYPQKRHTSFVRRPSLK